MKLALALLVVAVGALLDRSTEAYPHCAPCTDGNCDPPENCEYGIKMDYCGRMVCAKGPGQRCGGKFDVIGQCGDGTFCRCGRCIGCSLLKPVCWTQASTAMCV